MSADRSRYQETCKHWRGLIGPNCGAGVPMYSLAGGGDAWAARLPCTPFLRARAAELGVESVGCVKRDLPTEAELAAWEAARELSRERHAKAAPFFSELRQRHRGQSGHGTVLCPGCGTGALSWSIAGYNGHIHARCSTRGCIAFME